MRLQCRRSAKWGSDERDGGSAIDLDRVPHGHLASLAELDLAIDADASLGDENLGLTAGEDAAGQFQNLGQIDRAVAHGEAHAFGLTHFDPFGAAGSSPPSRRSPSSIESVMACSTFCCPFAIDLLMAL